jgi:hypothetical protein
VLGLNAPRLCPQGAGRNRAAGRERRGAFGGCCASNSHVNSQNGGARTSRPTKKPRARTPRGADWRARAGGQDRQTNKLVEGRVAPIPVAAFTESDDQALESFAKPFAEKFLVSPIAMRIRLEKLGLLHRTVPLQRLLSDDA